MNTNLKWETFAKQLLLQAEEAILLFDQAFTILGVNEVFCKTVRQEKNALLGQPVSAMFPGICSEAGFPLPESRTENWIGPDAQANTLKINFIYAENQNFSGGFLKLTPVKSIPAESWQPSLLQYLLQRAPLGWVVFDQEATIQEINHHALTFLGLKPSLNFIGKKLYDLPGPNHKNEITSGIESVLAGKPITLNLVSPLENDNFFRFDFLPLASHAGQVNLGLMVGQEILNFPELPASRNPSGKNLPPEPMLTVWITQIEERKRIASKIHNSLGQLLYGFRMELIKRGKNLPDHSKAFLNELLDEAINETKIISFELMPAMLEDFGLEATLEELVNKHQNPSLKLSYQVSGPTKRLNPNLEIIIFSVIQELVNNIIKHAKASKARIYLELVNKIITIKVIDNGQGFEKEKLLYAFKSTGLRNIKNSLKLFNGQIKISSQIGKGTLITVQIPLVRGSWKKKVNPVKK